MPWLTDLADAARKSGLKVTEVTGWRTRGHGPMTAVRGVMCHHTAGARTGNYPSLTIVRDGRPGLEGPLSQLGLARDGSVLVIAAGIAWHAGAGSWPGLTGNSDTVGIEAESVGDGKDWTAAQRAAYPRLCRALAQHYNVPASRVISHKEWAPTRKIDPAGIDMNALRAAVAKTTATQEDDDMTPDEYRQVFADILGEAAAGDTAFGRAIRDRINTIVTPSVTVGVWNAGFGSGETRQTAGQRLAMAAAGVDPAALAEQITAALPAPANAGGGSVSKTDVEQAIRDVLGSLNDQEATQ